MLFTVFSRLVGRNKLMELVFGILYKLHNSIITMSIRSPVSHKILRKSYILSLSHVSEVVAPWRRDQLFFKRVNLGRTEARLCLHPGF